MLELGEKALKVDVLQSMRYMRNVINEGIPFPRTKLLSRPIPIVLRLYPVVPQMNRVALTDTALPVGGGPDGSLPNPHPCRNGV